jgi:hypothetical protein
LSGHSIIQLDIGSDGLFYAVEDLEARDILLKSTDGILWDTIFTQMPCGTYWHSLQFLIDTTKMGDEIIYLLIKSTDYGDSWKSLSKLSKSF